MKKTLLTLFTCAVVIAFSAGIALAQQKQERG
jgi:hypothetical protein